MLEWELMVVDSIFETDGSSLEATASLPNHTKVDDRHLTDGKV